ncbi:hypothetical protein QUF99_26915 [Bacillus sp. DX4.1]|uniref:hypothetical protein n=1 Tax=Bacillus sp. DX4.1 TaxID=3055867 RepID=UPI0025A0C7CD|nr:hypothetical protein [Bacillus sp. DX4.1]MDM5190831.1 hypothetical protein [Bacillus sp. DX4.1]
MGIFVSEVETFYLCSATVTQQDCTFEFVVRSTPIGISISLVDDGYEQEWVPMNIETYMKVNKCEFPDEESKERFREECNSPTGWMLQMRGEDFGGDFHRAMRVPEYEAYQMVEKNIPRKMRKDVTNVPMDDESGDSETWGKRPTRLM